MCDKRILLDTSVWISFFGRTDQKRTDFAREVIKHCQEKGYKLFYCPQVEHELSKGKKGNENVTEMKKIATEIDGHSGNETWGKIDAITWGKWGTKWGDIEEEKLGEKLENQLPDKTKKSNKNDRSIVVTAKYENIKIILHENPKDFGKLTIDGILIIDLTSISNVKEFEDLINKEN